MESENNVVPLALLRQRVENLYGANPRLPFHGWPHVKFVAAKARVFADDLRADPDFVEVCALLHDLNFLSDRRSDAPAGADLRIRILGEWSLSGRTLDLIERVIWEAQTSVRGKSISLNAQALSDADMLFKALPITPVLFANQFFAETGSTLLESATQIVERQGRLFDNGLYFYSQLAKSEYDDWARCNLRLWQNVLIAIKDPDIQELVTAHESGSAS